MINSTHKGKQTPVKHIPYDGSSVIKRPRSTGWNQHVQVAAYLVGLLASHDCIRVDLDTLEPGNQMELALQLTAEVLELVYPGAWDMTNFSVNGSKSSGESDCIEADRAPQV